MTHSLGRQRPWLRRDILSLLGLLWVAWLLLSIPDGGRQQYRHPLDAAQLATDIQGGEVVAIVTQDANARVDIVYRDERPVISAHLPPTAHIDDMLRPYHLTPATSPGIRFIAMPNGPSTLTDWLPALRSYWLPPLAPPLLAASIAFLLYNLAWHILSAVR